MITIEGIDCPKGYRVIGYRCALRGDYVLGSNSAVYQFEDSAMSGGCRIIPEKIEPELRWQAVYTREEYPREVIGREIIDTPAQKQSMKHGIVAWIEHTFMDGELVSSKVERV